MCVFLCNVLLLEIEKDANKDIVMECGGGCASRGNAIMLIYKLKT